MLPALAIACGSESDSTGADGKLNVVATTVQIAALTREVGGDHIALRGLVPAGADTHEFEPVASDLAAIERAQLILRHGIGLDDWLDDTLAAARDAEVATVTEGIALDKPALVDDSTSDSDENNDPHVWQDPDRAMQMTNNIAAALAAADPANAATYRANAAAYTEKLRDTKAKVQAIIDEIPPERRKLVTNHDAFGYYAHAFGLTVVGAVIPGGSTQAEASAQDTAALLELIQREDVRAIFAESSVNPDLARTLADDAGIKIVDDLYGDSLGTTGSDAATVDGMLLANARKIADALK